MEDKTLPPSLGPQAFVSPGSVIETIKNAIQDCLVLTVGEDAGSEMLKRAERADFEGKKASGRFRGDGDVPETLVGSRGVYTENPFTKYYIYHGAITLYSISRDAPWWGLC